MEKAGEKRLKAVPWKPLQGARSESELLDILQREAIVGVLTETDGEVGRWSAQEGPE